MSDQSNSALSLAAQGLPVFPVWWMTGGRCACADRGPTCHPGKHPITPRGLHDASRDPVQIAEWWRIAPLANVGVALPDGILVVDVDPRNNGEATFDALTAEHGPLPLTRLATTGGGGAHFYLSTPPGLTFPQALGEGVDLKQLGGYVLAAPSNHKSGGSYKWITPHDYPLAPAPAWLLALGRPRGERSGVVEIDEDDSEPLPEREIARVVESLSAQFGAGKKHHLAFAIGGWLKQRGWNFGDVEKVIEQLPSKNPRARVKDARDGFRASNDHGWTKIKELVGEAPAAALDAAAANPRRARELADRASAAEVLAPAMAANAVTPTIWTPPAPVIVAPSGFPAWYQPAIILETPTPIDFIVPELELGPGRVNMIVGYSNVGKSIAADALAFAIAMGLPVWGRFAVKRRRVLYLDAENIFVTLENFSRFARGAGVSLAELRAWLTVVDSRLYLDNPNAEAELALVVQRANYGAVFVDTLRASVATLEENKAEMAIPLYMLGRVSKGTGSTITTLHHEKKPTNDKRSAVEHMISGTAAIHGALQVSISLVREDDSGIITARPSKRIRRGFDPFQMRIVDLTADGGTCGDMIAAGTASPGVRIEAVNAKPITAPANEDTLTAAIARITRWLRMHAADGRQVRLESVVCSADMGGCGGKRQTNLITIDRLIRDGVVHVSGSPKMIALAVEAPAAHEQSFAPPALPSLAESQDEMAAALRQEHES